MATKRKELWQHWKPGVVQTLDLSKSEHRDYLGERFSRGGLSPRNAKKVYEALEAAGREKAPKTSAASGDVLQALNALTALGFSADGTFASGFSAIPGGTVFTYIGLELIDPATGQSVGHNSRVEYNLGEYLPIEVQGTRPSGAKIEAILTVNYQVMGQFPVAQTVRFISGNHADGSPEVREPVKKAGNPNPDLRIALGAFRPMPGYDYWYRTLLPTHPDLRSPLVGSARYQSPIASAPSDVALYVIAPNRGGVSHASATTLRKFKRSLKVAGKKLSWSMPWSSNPANDSSVSFGSAAWGEPYVLLVCTFSVKIKKGDAPVFTTVYSAVPSSPDFSAGQPGVATIPPIQYIWR